MDPPSWDKLPKSEQANSQTLTGRYQDWSGKAEDYLLGTWALSSSELEASKGRGAPPVWKLAEVVTPNRHGDFLISDSASQWGALKGRLKQLSLHLARPQPGKAGFRDLQVRIIRCIQRLAGKAEISLGGLSVNTQAKALKVLADLKDTRWTTAALVARVLAERTGHVADEAADHLRQEKQASFRRWVLEGLDQPGAGRAHRFISDNGPHVRSTEHGEPEDEDLEWGHQAMETRVAFWNQYWKGSMSARRVLSTAGDMNPGELRKIVWFLAKQLGMFCLSYV